MRLLALIVLGCALAFPAATSAATQDVSIEFQTFGPGQLDILPGEIVHWQNVSERTHTVTADDSSFDSGDVDSGTAFEHEFDSTGTFAYHCTKHAGMTGEIDVRAVTLGSLPTAAIPAGDKVEFAGRTSDPSQPVRIERALASGYQTVATAEPAADGSWTANVTAQVTGDYRAAIGAGESETRHLIVSDRKVLVRATKRGVTVTVTPSLPYARIAFQQDLRERFGWWTTTMTRLDYV